MVESQVGFVAANISSMGPLFGKVGNSAKRLRNTFGSQSLTHESHGSTRHTAPQRGSYRGFERMMDTDAVGVKATVQPGSSNVDKDFTESIPMNEIVVKTNMEQNVNNLSSQEEL